MALAKDRLDIDCFECLIKGFGACSSCRRWWMGGEETQEDSAPDAMDRLPLLPYCQGNKTYYRR